MSCLYTFATEKLAKSTLTPALSQSWERENMVRI